MTSAACILAFLLVAIRVCDLVDSRIGLTSIQPRIIGGTGVGPNEYPYFGKEHL